MDLQPDSTSLRSVVADVIVVGGGPAGLSAALALGRSRRSVVVVDGGQPRNAPAAHMHGVLGHDGRPPTEFLALGRADLAAYDVTIVDGLAVDAVRDDHGFAVTLDDGSIQRCRRILVATGAVDELPAITNLRARWGRDVVHCPYCHGWEVQDTRTAVISTGPMGVHGANLFRQWSDDVTLFVHTGPAPTPEERARLAARGTDIVEGVVDEIVVDDDRITGIRLASGEIWPAETVLVGSRVVASSPVLDALGVPLVAHPMGADLGMGYADPTGATDVAGVWAAGNVVDGFATVPAAVAAGYLAGAHLNADLVTEDTDRAVADATPAPASPPVMDRAFWDDRYSVADRVWSGNPNPHLVTDTAALPVGHAVDVGAGEGADAIWLAEQGWTVDAVDISPVAIDRGRTEAATRAGHVDDRIAWSVIDVLADGLPSERYDLVSAHFMHFGEADRRRFYDACIGAVAPGGTLLVVAHDASDHQTTAGRWNLPGFFFTAADVAEQLDEAWTVTAIDTRPRQTIDPHGDEITIHDAVLVAHRAGNQS